MAAGRQQVRERAQYAIGPLCQAVSAREVEAWIAAAQPGDDFVYATGPALPQGMASVCMVRELVDAGQVRTHVRRNPDSRALEHVAVRRAVAAAAAGVSPAGVEAPDPNGPGATAARRMMQLLNRAAITGRPCPTNAELAETLGLKNKQAAQYIFNRLVRVGKIRVADFGPRMRRVVTICATGNSTRQGVAL